jgi:hypothetical protein
MTRLSIGLTLLLMSFLAALDHVERVHTVLARIGVQRWMTELAIAAVAVGLFFRAGRLHRRMLFPRRGLRLLAAGIAVHAVAIAAGTGIIVRALQWVPAEAATPWGGLPQLADRVPAQPLFFVAQVLLVLGAFRALCNLVPPAEFEADY